MKTKKEEITAWFAYKRYTSQFKEQALERTDRDGLPKVAQDLGVAEATLYAWKAKRRWEVIIKLRVIKLDDWDFSSKLSPWLSQGCISPRRVLTHLGDYERQVGSNESTYWLYFELLWREYFQWLLYKYGSRLFHLRGTRDVNPLLTFYPEAFMAWKNGNTESDFVNAFMRQLKGPTGYQIEADKSFPATWSMNLG